MLEEPELVVASLDTEARPLAEVLSPDERQRASRFLFDRDRRRFIVARARLRQLLGERLGEPPAAIEFVYGEHGKPALARRPGGRDLRFNLAHCDDVAVYAFAEGAEVGIDVEAVRALEDAAAVAERFFSSAEYEAYRGLGESERAQGFFNCWTRKEAFIKALGTGLSHPLDSFDVSLVPGEPTKILRAGGIRGERCRWTLHGFVPGAGLVGAIAVQIQ